MTDENQESLPPEKKTIKWRKGMNKERRNEVKNEGKEN
jgi:hypothetical protein